MRSVFATRLFVPNRSAETKKAHGAAFTVTEVRSDQARGVSEAFAKASETPLAWSDLTSVTVKAAPWAFFVSALRFGTNSLVANTDLITKVYLPRVIFPLAAVFSQLVDFLLAGAVVSLFLVVVGAGFSVYLLWLPVLLAPL